MQDFGAITQEILIIYTKMSENNVSFFLIGTSEEQKGKLRGLYIKVFRKYKSFWLMLCYF